MEENKKHLQLPNELIKVETIAPKDLLVYLAIKRYENWETHEAFPSLETIAKVCSCTSKTVKASIDRLIQSGYLEVKKNGRGKLYIFKKYKDFETFSLDFLDNDNLSFTEKAYLAAQQQFLIKDNGLGKTTYSSYEMGEKISMPPSTIRKCDKSLEAKEYLTIVKTKDSENNCLKTEKIFQLEKFGQAVVFVLQNHESSINENKENIKKLQQQLNESNKTNRILLEEINRLRKKEDLPEIILD